MRPKQVTKSNNGYLEAAPLRSPNDLTEYERQVATLTPQQLRNWVRRNVGSKYIPEEVLKSMGITSRWNTT